MSSPSDHMPIPQQPHPENRGRVVAVRGSVVDVAFNEHDLPDIHEALEIRWDLPGRLAAEVQQHLDPGTVRAVALGGTAGLKRGTPVNRTHAPITVPVGEAVLGRLVDQGNTVLVIEHNLDVIKTADHLIDLGPEGGSRGGEVVACGSPEEVARVSASYTGRYLRPYLKP